MRLALNTAGRWSSERTGLNEACPRPCGALLHTRSWFRVQARGESLQARKSRRATRRGWLHFGLGRSRPSISTSAPSSLWQAARLHSLSSYPKEAGGVNAKSEAVVLVLFEETSPWP